MSVYDVHANRITSVYQQDAKRPLYAFDLDGDQVWRYGPDLLNACVLTALPPISESGTKQGGCTDGVYIYQTSGDSANYTYMKLIKYKISDGTYTVKRFDGTPNFGHANDMTYNPVDGYLYICTMLDDGSVIVINPDDLSYVKTVYVNDSNGNPYKLWQICYDRNTSQFLSAHGNQFLFYDNEWNYLSSIDFPTHPNATGQGCETDGIYIYRVTYNPNLVDVATMDGIYVKTMSNPMTGEPETMAYDWDGHYYIIKNSTTDVFYSAQLFA